MFEYNFFRNLLDLNNREIYKYFKTAKKEKTYSITSNISEMYIYKFIIHLQIWQGISL